MLLSGKDEPARSTHGECAGLGRRPRDRMIRALIEWWRKRDRFKSSQGKTAAISAADSRMDRVAVPHDVVMRNHKALQRRVDVIEVDVGDEAVDRGIDAG